MYAFHSARVIDLHHGLLFICAASCTISPLCITLLLPGPICHDAWINACYTTLITPPPVHVGSYLLAASAGPAFPSSYVHADGGSYRGEWRGMQKEGLGVYK
jgi:hypothetical protein